MSNPDRNPEPLTSQWHDALSAPAPTNTQWHDPLVTPPPLAVDTPASSQPLPPPTPASPNLTAQFPYILPPPRREAKWRGAAKATLASSRALLTLFAAAAAVVLTIFSASGIVTFQGQVIKWKLLLFSLLLEAAIFVAVRDALALAFDYLLVYHGVTHSQLSHAMAVMTTLKNVRGPAYKASFIVITGIAGVIGPLLLSIVLDRSGDIGSNRVPAPNMRVSTNTIGGRIGDNFGATGQSFLFNTSEEKYRIIPGAEHYTVYIRAGTARQIFVPKTPQIGPYSTDCNSKENENVVQARVLDVQGLLYKCVPKVDERPDPIESFTSPFAGTSDDTYRLLQDDHRAVGDNKEKAKFNVTMAIKKGEASTAVLNIPCDVTAARATLDVVMNEAGIMGMTIVDNDIAELSLELPPRVIGADNNSLDLALENSIGRKAIGIVSKYVVTDINDWDGLVRAITGAYGIRSALQTTFADQDDKRAATNVFVLAEDAEETQNLRVFALWIPVVLAALTRFVSWLFPSIFTGGLDQVLCWMGTENGYAGGVHYRESGVDKAPEKVWFLRLEVVEDARSRLGLAASRDMQIGLGSYRYVRRLTRRGLLGGFGQVSSEGTGGSVSAA